MKESNFDWQGFSEEKLQKLCAEDTSSTKVKMYYWPAEAYSSGTFLREYAFYPSFLPLYCYSEHGIRYQLDIDLHERTNNAPFHILYHKEFRALFQKEIGKPCYQVEAPLPWIRKKRKLEKYIHAKGTIAFFSHSTPDVVFADDVRTIVDEYIASLKELPSEMQPVCVCLHMHDINNGTYKYFLEKNIPVYTVGNAYNPHFAENFYDILLNFNYSTSNALGSNVWYSVEAEIPFFLYGKGVAYKNIGSAEFALGALDDNKNELYYELVNMFSTRTKSVTLEQKVLAEKILGIPSELSRIKLSYLLYTAFLKNMTRHDIRMARKLISRKIRSFFPF